jgi:hypothetical protein
VPATGLAFLACDFFDSFLIWIDVNRSVCLTTNGEIFTWGDNAYGQLGRTQGDGWGYPQLVPSLMGTRISQVTRLRRAWFACYVFAQPSLDWLRWCIYRSPIGARLDIHVGQVKHHHAFCRCIETDLIVTVTFYHRA